MDLSDDHCEGASVVRLKTLLENGTWVRSLARRLLYDEGLTNDVVQEVWIAALRSSPRSPELFRAWLRGIVRKIAFETNRRETRRRRRETAVTKSSSVPSAATIAEQLEIHGILTEAINALREPYRTAIYLRFFEGLRAVEIAKEMDAGDSTVRTWIGRGVESLRKWLDEHYGDRKTWRAALLPIVFGSQVTPLVEEADPAGPEIGAPPAGRSLTSLLSAVGVCGIALVIWFVSALIAQSGDVADLQGAAPETTGVREEQTSELAAPSQQTDSQTAVVASSVSRPAATRRLQMVDSETGIPVVGASVYASRKTRRASIPLGVSGDGGILDVATEVLERDALQILAEGYLERREPLSLRDVDGETPFVVELEPTVLARVAVRDRRGVPIPAAEVTVWSTVRGLEDPAPNTYVSDAAGIVEYEYRYKTTNVIVHRDGYASVSCAVQIPETLIEMDLGARYLGIVVDERGDPIGRCRVQASSMTHRRADLPLVTDELGVFRLGGVDAKDTLTFTLRHPEYPPFETSGLAPQAGQAWKVVMPAGVTVFGEIVAPDGSPLKNGTVFAVTPQSRKKRDVASVSNAALPRNGRARRQFTPVAKARVVDGRYELGPLARSLDEPSLFVHHKTSVSTVCPLDLTEAEQEPLVLERGISVRGRVVTTSGEPRAGVLLHFGAIWSNDSESVLGRARSGSDGRFQISGLPLAERPATAGVVDTLHRTSVFVTSFAPDRIRRVAGPAETLFELSPNAFEIPSGTAELVVTVDTDSRVADVEFRLRDRDGTLRRVPTRVVYFATGGRIYGANLGPRREGSLFVDQAIRFEDAGPFQLLFMPEGLRWQALSVSSVRNSDIVDVDILDQEIVSSRVVTSDLAGVSRRGVVLALGFPYEAPRFAVGVGKTDAAGSVGVSCLEPRLYRMFVPKAGRAPILAAPAGQGAVWNCDDCIDAGLVDLSRGGVVDVRLGEALGAANPR